MFGKAGLGHLFQQFFYNVIGIFWCSVCQNQKPAVELLSTDSELSEVFLGEVEYDDHPDKVTAASVEGFPTILIYKDGQEVALHVRGWPC